MRYKMRRIIFDRAAFCLRYILLFSIWPVWLSFNSCSGWWLRKECGARHLRAPSTHSLLYAIDFGSRARNMRFSFFQPVVNRPQDHEQTESVACNSVSISSAHVELLELCRAVLRNHFWLP
ncbi:uncharacterized protein BKA78DRAFT_97603 [Phyllosticta capitalensis]|uniref:uncharacterized protein n=1 Tax=Phyllosticta capitalensis TaxID=121624 RepID=UPI00313049A4